MQQTERLNRQNRTAPPLRPGEVCAGVGGPQRLEGWACPGESTSWLSLPRTWVLKDVHLGGRRGGRGRQAEDATCAYTQTMAGLAYQNPAVSQHSSDQEGQPGLRVMAGREARK